MSPGASRQRRAPELMARNARLRVLGRTTDAGRCSTRHRSRVHETRNNTGLTVLMAFNYGARDELIDAFGRWRGQVLAGELKPERSRKRRSASLSTPRTSRSRPADPHEPARCGSPNFLRGRSPTRSSGSRRRSGRTSALSISYRAVGRIPGPDATIRKGVTWPRPRWRA